MRKEVVVQWIFGNLLVNKRNEFRWVFSQPHWPKLIRDPGRMVRFKGVIYIYMQIRNVHRFFSRVQFVLVLCAHCCTLKSKHSNSTWTLLQFHCSSYWICRSMAMLVCQKVPFKTDGSMVPWAVLGQDLYITPDLILLASQWEPGFGWYPQSQV